MFQFPSNGKAYPKFAKTRWTYSRNTVSIPFKRESVSKECRRRVPSQIWNCVSIPFKRESVSKGHPGLSPDALPVSFQFPSNGKAYPKSIAIQAWWGLDFLKFQFPSNGKAYPKYLHMNTDDRFRKKVSIPFKRESVSKGVDSSSC